MTAAGHRMDGWITPVSLLAAMDGYQKRHGWQGLAFQFTEPAITPRGRPHAFMGGVRTPPPCLGRKRDRPAHDRLIVDTKDQTAVENGSWPEVSSDGGVSAIILFGATRG